MKLADDAKHVPRYWSFRLAILAAVLSAVEVTLPLYSQVVPTGVFASLSMTVAVAAAAARAIKQEIRSQ